MNRTLLLSGTLLSIALLTAPAHAQDGGPVETRPANAPDQQPAFAGQTRSPQPADMAEITTEVVAEDLPHLWSMEFLPDGRMLVTAKQGAMHLISAAGEAGPEIQGVPPGTENGR